MPIVDGLDIHRKQLTFDYLDTVTGEVQRGQIAPADRAHLRAWLARFAGRGDVAFALEGCTGWRYVAEELAGAGVAAHVAEPADTAFARGRKRRAKTDPTRGTCGCCWPRAGCRSAGSRRRTSWNAGRCGPPRQVWRLLCLRTATEFTFSDRGRSGLQIVPFCTPAGHRARMCQRHLKTDPLAAFEF